MTTRSRGTELLDGILKGGDPDGRLTTELHAKYEQPLKARAKKILQRYPALRGRVDPSDLYQSVFAGLRQAKVYQEVASGTAVLTTRLKDRAKHHNRAVTQTQQRDRTREDGSDEARDGLSANTPTPADAVADREQVENATRQFESLSETDRTILTLHELDELTFKEIGPMLKVKPDTARKRYAAARRRLLAKLADGTTPE